MRILTKLAQPVFLDGTVEHGFSRGSKTLGFATANVNASSSKSVADFLASPLCKDGIYIGWARIPGIHAPFKAAISVGINPTFEDSKVRLLEAHLIDYSGPDFYDENLRVILCAFMRESLKFTTVESLKTEIQTDCDFATKSLAKDVDLVISRLDKHSIKSKNDLLVHSDTSLSQLLGISISSCRDLILKVQPVKPIDIANEHDYISSSLSQLDSSLGNGFERGWLVEIFGEAGSGKTQWCFTIAVHALRNGTRVIWIDSENSFRPERIVEIAQETKLLDRICICKCNSMEQLLMIMTEFSEDPESVIIVDSIAALGRNNMKKICERQELIHKFAILAKKLTKSLVICTNQVIADFTNTSFKPALGNTWSHDVTCRIWLRMDPQHGKRFIDVQKAPSCGKITLPVLITPLGVIDD